MLWAKNSKAEADNVLSVTGWQRVSLCLVTVAAADKAGHNAERVPINGSTKDGGLSAYGRSNEVCLRSFSCFGW